MRPSRSLRRARRRAPSLSFSLLSLSLSSSRFRSSRGLSLSLPLDIVPPLFRVTFSLFHPPIFPRARSPTFALCAALSRSPLALVPPLVSISVRIGTSSAPLASLFLFRGLSFRRRGITTLSRLARSSSNPPPARHLAAACIFAFFSLSLSTLSHAPSLSLSLHP